MHNNRGIFNHLLVNPAFKPIISDFEWSVKRCCNTTSYNNRITTINIILLIIIANRWSSVSDWRSASAVFKMRKSQLQASTEACQPIAQRPPRDFRFWKTLWIIPLSHALQAWPAAFNNNFTTRFSIALRPSCRGRVLSAIIILQICKANVGGLM